MTSEEWEKQATAYLDWVDEMWPEIFMLTSEFDVQFGNATRLRHAYLAAQGNDPDLTLGEFKQRERVRTQAGTGAGRRKGSVTEWRRWAAALDARLLKEKWKALNPDHPTKRPPVHPHEIVANKYGITRDDVDEYVRRERIKWPRGFRELLP